MRKWSEMLSAPPERLLGLDRQARPGSADKGPSRLSPTSGAIDALSAKSGRQTRPLHRDRDHFSEGPSLRVAAKSLIVSESVACNACCSSCTPAIRRIVRSTSAWAFRHRALC